MALNINGTTGISGVDGSASAPAVTGTDSNTGINFASDTVNINTGGSTRYSVDSSGNIQAGGANPVFTGSSLSSFKITAPDGGSRYFFGEIGNSASAQLSLYDSSDSQKIRISAHSSDATFFNSGKVLIGNTSGVDSSNSGIRLQNPEVGSCRFGCTTTSNKVHIQFLNGNGIVGGIDTNGSSTAYNTSSDYRLKENVIAISDGITRLKTLKPSRFNFKVDKDITVDGFLAHEVTPAVPEAITGTKDEVDSDNNPVYQGIDQSKLVPLLTAALQEAVAKIEVLETKVAALEAG